ncbi:MAG: EAL domain-containing protein, partial [Ruminiclostridium sp.]|nr:EAL domain-containing protein [Ruminiclostridium sp.]
MQLSSTQKEALRLLLSTAATRKIEKEDLVGLCETLKIARMYYETDLSVSGSFSDIIMSLSSEKKSDRKIETILIYDSGKTSDVKLRFSYSVEGQGFVYGHIEICDEVPSDEIDYDTFQFISNIIYILLDRDNMKKLLDLRQTTDAQTGIPNIILIGKRFTELLINEKNDDYAVIFFNLRNYRHINETAGSRCGDEIIRIYSHKLVDMLYEDECPARMGGDNFSAIVRKDHLSDIIEQLHSVSVSDPENSPGRTFELSAWIGVSEGIANDRRPFSTRLSEASAACIVGKTKLRQNVTFFTEELRLMLNRNKEIVAMFRPALSANEFIPFFQPKIDMSSGELIGFEALCRWIHNGTVIYPESFIHVLDRESMIHELDMKMFLMTCEAIKRWKDMGFEPPRISSNFARENLFVPRIEDKICSIIEEVGIEPGDVEIEITESVRENETSQLIHFVNTLRQRGIHISIDDFGTGYSSLQLIHSIEADALKIDKSFICSLADNHKSMLLIESVINIADNLGMSVIAEGVETIEQGKELMRLVC